MTLGIQVDGVNGQRTIVITDQNPEIEYYISPSNVVYSSGNDDTTLTISFSAGSTSYQGSVVLILTGSYRTRCFTIKSNTTSQIVVYGDASGSISTSDYIAVVYSASKMYDYCNTNNYDIIALTCEQFTWNEGSPENPQSLATHITYRAGTGVFNTLVTMTGCSIWERSPLDRMWKTGQMRHLIFQWNKIDQLTGVYLIITAEDDVNGVTLCQNFPFFDEYTTNVDPRGYLKGFPMKTNGTYKYNAEFTLKFAEATLL